MSQTIEQQIAELESQIDSEPQTRAVIDENTKLSIIWAKVQPFVLLLTNMVRGKVKRYLEAFAAAINTLVAKEEPEEGEV